MTKRRHQSMKLLLEPEIYAMLLDFDSKTSGFNTSNDNDKVNDILFYVILAQRLHFYLELFVCQLKHLNQKFSKV